jgi:predicted DNA binding CopG/RHH family protein
MNNKLIANLTKEEKEMRESIDWSSLKPVTAAEQKRLRSIARNTLANNKTITVRLSERNLVRLKAAAMREGIPYQTLVSSLIQKHI